MTKKIVLLDEGGPLCALSEAQRLPEIAATFLVDSVSKKRMLAYGCRLLCAPESLEYKFRPAYTQRAGRFPVSRKRYPASSL